MEFETKFDREVDALEKNLKNAKERQKKHNSQSSTVKLAHHLHEMLCSLNHDDGCSYGYYDWGALPTNFRSDQQHYLEMAQGVEENVQMLGLEIQQIVSVMLLGRRHWDD